MNVDINKFIEKVEEAATEVMKTKPIPYPVAFHAMAKAIQQKLNEVKPVVEGEPVDARNDGQEGSSTD